MRSYDPEDSVSNEIANAVGSAQVIGMTVERFIEIAKQCWVEGLQQEIQRVVSLK